MKNNNFEVKESFYHKGKEIKIISGGIHYFRIVPEYWRDRLEKLKGMGCNTVETYVPWNMHEPHKGEYNFEGILNIKKFIQIADELGLFVIVRPSPYICAEWEFGGLPAWLLGYDGMKLRCNYEPYLSHVRDYYKVLFEILVPLQSTNGGPIIMMQVENEYGYYGDDTKYLEAIRDMMIDYGTNVPLVTSDGPWGDALTCGKIDGVLPTANFGSKSEEQFNILKKHTNGGPLMCMEFWVGWFDSWGSKEHKTSDLKQNVNDLYDTLKLGHINIYMFIGGTNFGFMNGSNYYDELTPDVTSYDYDAVLTEAGEITPKYLAFKEVISQFKVVEDVPFTTNIITLNYGQVSLKDKVGLFESLEDISKRVFSTFTLPMEKLDQNYGYVLYQSPLRAEEKVEKLRLWDANDRANIYINEKNVATLYDRELLTEITLNEELDDNSNIMILTENMGRVNFGPNIEKQRKGIDRGVQINGHMHMNWNHYSLPLDNLDKLDFTKGHKDLTPGFYSFELEVSELGDTYIDMTGWGKGSVFINGFNLGRFWEVGPQKHLYLPAPLLHKGSNEIIIFETEGKVMETIYFSDKPNLG